MKKLAFLFIVAIVGPSLVLAWLSIRTARDQEFILERQREQLHVTTAHQVADRMSVFLGNLERDLRAAVDAHVAAGHAAADFPSTIPTVSGIQGALGFFVSRSGQLVTGDAGDETRRFSETYTGFLAGGAAMPHYRWFSGGEDGTRLPDSEAIAARSELAAAAASDTEPAELADARDAGDAGDAAGFASGRQGGFPESGDLAAAAPLPDQDSANEPAFSNRSESSPPSQSKGSLGAEARAPRASRAETGRRVAADVGSAAESANASEREAEAEAEMSPAALEKSEPPIHWPHHDRLVVPRVIPGGPAGPLRSEFLSTVTPFASAFAFANSGIVSVLDSKGDHLKLLVWYRPVPGGEVFGMAMDGSTVQEQVPSVLETLTIGDHSICAAVLNHLGQAAGTVGDGVIPTDWRKPFVAVELGAALPKWEAVTYLTHPDEIAAVARNTRLRLGMIVLAIVAAIGFGGLLLLRDVRGQVSLARQKSDFVNSVSHELKTPLTSIRMFSDLLIENRDTSPEKAKRYAEVIGTEASRLTRLIDNVLDFGRVDRGDMSYNFEPVAIQAVVSDTVAHHRPQLEQSGFTIAVRGNGGTTQVIADRDALSQVLVNLLSNAEKYGGGAQREIEVSISTDPATAEVKVSDRGQGVPAGSENRIFERFFRAENQVDRGNEGSGLGLALAREIMDAHGGSLSYSPRAGGGSSFSITLPLARTGHSGETPPSP